MIENKIKAKVLIPFFDKYTGKKYQKGDPIEVTEKRFKEILEKGKLIEAVNDTANKEKK